MDADGAAWNPIMNKGDTLGNIKRKKKVKKPKPIKNPAAKTSSGLADPSGFKHGGKVKKTGYALVHKGERVITASESKGHSRKRGKKSARKRTITKM